MELIGLSGYARSGKDEAAKILIEEFGFTRVAFADKLRDVLYALNPIVDMMGQDMEVETDYVGPDTPMKLLGGHGPLFLQQVIDKYGWNGYKETRWGTEIRRLLQRLGTEAGRQTMWDSIWIDAALTGLPEDAKVVVTDCRFENEAQGITERGGQVWRITRKGVGPINDHPSETGLDKWRFDKRLANYGTLEEWYDQIRSTYRGYI